MDVIEASAIVTVLFAIVVGVQHMWDRYAPNGLYRRTERRASGIATEVGAAVKSGIMAASVEMAAQAEAAVADEAKSMQMSMVRSVGVDKQAQAQATAAIAEGILGNAMPILRMVVPGIADQLEENPQLIFALIENPYFKKYVLPRIQGFLPNADGTPAAGSGASFGGVG